MNTKRVLIFSLAYFPHKIGGAEVAVKEITDRISPDEIEFDMITINSGREAKNEKIGNVNVHRLFNGFGVVQKLLFPWFAARKAQELHRKRDYTATWAIMASYAGYAAYLFKKKNKTVPFVLTIQEGENFGRRSLLAPLFRRIFAAANRVQAISNFLADWSKHMGATCPVVVIPNAVDYDHFAREIDPDDRRTLRERCGFADTDTVIVTASRLVRKNAIDVLINSLIYLDASYKLLVLGSGPELAKLSSLVSDLRATGRVIFKGFIRHDDLPTYLQSADVFARPSRTEGLGNSFLEAMAAGIPVVATPVGGIVDFLKDGETGLFAEVDNPRSVAQKIEKATKDRESRRFIVTNATAMVREKYGWEMISRKMKELW